MREPREVINVRSLVEDAIRRNAQPAAKADEFAQPRIVVVGCGGAGNNMVNRIAQMGVKGAELIAINTDKQHLSMLSDDITKILVVTQRLARRPRKFLARRWRLLLRVQILFSSLLVLVVVLVRVLPQLLPKSLRSRAPSL